MSPIHNDVTLWVGALRYYMGRKTYAVSHFCDMLISNWDNISKGAKTIIEKDVEYEFQRDDDARESNMAHLPLGDDMDRKEWERVRKLWMPANEQVNA